MRRCDIDKSSFHYHTPVLVKGGMIYYMENKQLNKANMPTRDGDFKCCEPFDLSHNVVSGNHVIGPRAVKIVIPSPPHFLIGKFFWIPLTETEDRSTKSNGRYLGIQGKR